MKFQYYRIFVERVKQQSLLDEPHIEKQDLLYEAFNQRTPLHFRNGGQKLAFVAQKESEPYILGSLAKSTTVSIQHAPEENFETEEMTSWPRVPIVISVSSDEVVGQCIAIGINQQVFEHPLVQLKKLAEELNRLVLKPKGFEMIINAVTYETNFWHTVDEYKGKIKSIKFNYASPNLFNTEDKLNDELRHARDVFGATNSSVELENDEGGLNVPEDDPFMKQSVDYVTKGGGDYKIKLTKRRTVTSEDSVAAKEVDETEIEISAKTKSTLKEMCDKLFLWLKNLE